MQTIIEKIANDFGLKRRSGKFIGPCPECGGALTSDRFNIRDDGGFKCYACDFKGDIITWLMKKEGMNCPEAHAEAQKVCTNTGCPVWSGCSQGAGNGSGTYRPRSVAPAVHDPGTNLAVAQVMDPAEKWMVWATGLATSAEKNLQQRQADLCRLQKRGIDQAAVTRFGLGWIERNTKVDRATIGLPPRDDGKTTLWVPAGLLIPIFDWSGRLHRLRVRRSEHERKNFLPDLKYVWIQGAGTAPMVIRPEGGPARGAVIVEAELDAMAVSSSHDLVMVIALGTVRAGLPSSLRTELSDLPTILVSLDSDPGKDGKAGAGPKAISAWTSAYRQAKFWPVPEGKDPGNYAELGGSLHDWIEAGLYPVPQQSTPGYDLQSLSDCSLQGGAGRRERQGVGKISAEACQNAAVERKITLINGRTLFIAENKQQWDKLADAGHIVFSENELQRLGAACADLEPAEAVVLKNAVLDAKEVFGSAYIYRGGPVREVS